MLIRIRKAYLCQVFDDFNSDRSTQYWTVLEMGGNKKKSINFMATIFSPGGSSGAKCRRKRASTSPKSPSSVVPDAV